MCALCQLPHVHSLPGGCTSPPGLVIWATATPIHMTTPLLLPHSCTQNFLFLADIFIGLRVGRIVSVQSSKQENLKLHSSRWGILSPFPRDWISCSVEFCVWRRRRPCFWVRGGQFSVCSASSTYCLDCPSPCILVNFDLDNCRMFWKLTRYMIYEGFFRKFHSRTIQRESELRCLAFLRPIAQFLGCLFDVWSSDSEPLKLIFSKTLNI